MQRGVLSGRSDKALRAPLIALDRFLICHFAGTKQFKSVEVYIVEILVLSFIRDEDLPAVNDRSFRSIQDLLIRWRIQFTREKYGITAPAEDDTYMVGTFHIGRLWCVYPPQIPTKSKLAFGSSRTLGSEAGPEANCDQGTDANRAEPEISLDDGNCTLCAARLLKLGS
jgi:hypothetical protein